MKQEKFNELFNEHIRPFNSCELTTNEFYVIVGTLANRVRIFDGPKDKSEFIHLMERLNQYIPDPIYNYPPFKP